jgi:hypothetical protein
MSDFSKHRSEIVSLTERRQQRNQQVLTQQKSETRRLAELEAEMLRVIDQLLDVTDRVEKQESHLRQLIRALASEPSSSHE